ncbi:MAG: YkvA family protein [Paraclostridium sp.]
MKKAFNIIDVLLDTLKRTLVRFKNAKFGLLFIINMFKLPDFFTDREVNIISKGKVGFALLTALGYLVSGIDFLPEMIAGVFGFIDDMFVLLWSLGIVNEEVEKYKKIKKERHNPNIIEDVPYSIYDED